MAWDPSSDAEAVAAFDVCDRVLALVGDRAEALVSHSVGTAGLTRFANSRIHQNVAEDQAHLRLRVIVGGGRVAQATTTRLDAASLHRPVDSTLAAARSDERRVGKAGVSTVRSGGSPVH